MHIALQGVHLYTLNGELWGGATVSNTVCQDNALKFTLHIIMPVDSQPEVRQDISKA